MARDIQPPADAAPALVARLVDSLEKALRFAFTGSAAHGSFLRGGGGEYVPSVFLTLEELRAVLREGQAAAPAVPAKQEEEARRAMWVADHYDRHGSLTKRERYIECVCGATYWEAGEAARPVRPETTAGSGPKIARSVEETIREAAAAIASRGNGLPQEAFARLAEDVQLLLVCYAHGNKKTLQALHRQDVDFLARTLQAAYEIGRRDGVTELEGPLQKVVDAMRENVAATKRIANRRR